MVARLTDTDACPLVDVSAVFTLQPFTRLAGVHLGAHLPSLTGAHQTAGTVVQDQGNARVTHRGLFRALASPRTHLGPG